MTIKKANDIKKKNKKKTIINRKKLTLANIIKRYSLNILKKSK